MMIFWDDAYEPPMPPADPAPAEPPQRLPAADDPDEDAEQDRQPPGRTWQVERFAVPEEPGHPDLLALPAISLAWLFVVALYLR